jgi:hypothetical protein
MSKVETAEASPSTPDLLADFASSRNYLPALAVYVVWHPNNKRGRELATSLYDRLTCDSKDPVARGIGVPVYFRTGTPDVPMPRPIPLGEARHTAVVVLIDDEMIRDRTNGWAELVSTTWGRTEKNDSDHRMLPVALTRYAFDFAPAISEANFIRFYEADKGKQVVQLLINVTHELCRLLLKAPRADHGNPEAAPMDRRVMVFISHAKGDGLSIAKAINSYIRNDTQLNTFFDSNDILYGEQFPRVIRDQAARCAMLVVQTDMYGTRNWCQEEVLLAKGEKRPVLVLDAINEGEARSFPYLYNGPKVRHNGKEPPQFEPIVARMLLEVLRTEHYKQQFEGLRDLFNISEGQGIEFLPYPPELLTLAEMRLRENADAASQGRPEKKPAKTFVYPDPPLGVNETKRLGVFAEGLRLITPILLLTEGQRQAAAAGDAAAATGPELRPTETQGHEMLKAAAGIVKTDPNPDGWQIGLSISDLPEHELLALGLGPEHLAHAMVEFARYALAANYFPAYGGDLREGGFTETLHELVKTYNTENYGPDKILFNYLAWYVHKAASAEEMNRYAKSARQVLVGLPDDLARYESQPLDTKSPEFPYIRARALTKMREHMNERIKARVILGGRLVGYGGIYPGLAEEAVIAVSTNRPLYLIGRFGGCARAVIEAIKGGTPEGLTETYQMDSTRNPGYAARAADFNHRANEANQSGGGAKRVEPIDYGALVKKFNDYKVEGLSAHNGLKVEENLKLFENIHVEEMIYLVLKGLLEVGRNHGKAG